VFKIGVSVIPVTFLRAVTNRGAVNTLVLVFWWMGSCIPLGICNYCLCCIEARWVSQFFNHCGKRSKDLFGSQFEGFQSWSFDSISYGLVGGEAEHHSRDLGWVKKRGLSHGSQEAEKAGMGWDKVHPSKTCHSDWLPPSGPHLLIMHSATNLSVG
jgi:hypothetical protein